MHAAKTKTLAASVPPEQLFTATLRAVEDGNYTVTASDEGTRTMAFSRGKTALSWGQEYEAAVESADQGSTLRLTCGGVDGAPKALMDGWKNGRAADKFLQSVQARL